MQQIITRSEQNEILGVIGLLNQTQVIVKMKKKYQKATNLYFESVPVVEVNLRLFTKDNSPIRHIERSEKGSEFKLKDSNVRDRSKQYSSHMPERAITNNNREVSPELESLLSKVRNQTGKVKYKIQKNRTVACSNITKPMTTTSRIVDKMAGEEKENGRRSTSRRNKIFSLASKVFDKRGSKDYSQVNPIEIRMKTDSISEHQKSVYGGMGHCRNEVPKYTSDQIYTEQSFPIKQQEPNRQSIVIKKECGGLSFEGQEWFTKLGRFC